MLMRINSVRDQVGILNDVHVHVHVYVHIHVHVHVYAYVHIHVYDYMVYVCRISYKEGGPKITRI